jgi:hypothetical protein
MELEKLIRYLVSEYFKNLKAKNHKLLKEINKIMPEKYNQLIEYSCFAEELVNLLITIPKKAYSQNGEFNIEYSQDPNNKNLA